MAKPDGAHLSNSDRCAVYFATTPTPTTPRIRVICWIIRVLTLSRLVHCSIAVDGYPYGVIDMTLRGTRFYPHGPYANHYPGLVIRFDIDLPRPPDMTLFEEPRPVPKSVWPIVLRWLTRGRTKSIDCVTVVAQTLRSGGIGVPDRIVSPRQLCRWLISQGYTPIPMEPL